MERRPSLFVRKGDPYLATDEVTPECRWVVDGEGVATEKIDGTCCLVRGERLYARHQVRAGKLTPPGFDLVAHHPTTGAALGWVPFDPARPDHRWHAEAWGDGSGFEDGTYELIGPKIQGNPHRVPSHRLVRHGAWTIGGNPRMYDEVRVFLAEERIEGVVWHHPDGRRCKIKRRDFGMVWP